jgi:hypothetical protein
MSYHPGSNLAGEDGYGLRGMNPETTSTDRSTSTLHSTSMTRTCPTSDPFSTFPEDDSESGESLREVKAVVSESRQDSVILTNFFLLYPDYREIKQRKPRKDDPIDMGKVSFLSL